MSTEIFKASVQYDDLKGSSAADRADFDDAEKWLIENGHIEKTDNLVGITFYTLGGFIDGENPISVQFLIDSEGKNISAQAGTEEEPVDLKQVYIEDFSISQFFALFKRFNITLSPDGDLENKVIRVAK